MGLTQKQNKFRTVARATIEKERFIGINYWFRQIYYPHRCGRVNHFCSTHRKCSPGYIWYQFAICQRSAEVGMQGKGMKGEFMDRTPSLPHKDITSCSTDDGQQPTEPLQIGPILFLSLAMNKRPPVMGNNNGDLNSIAEDSQSMIQQNSCGMRNMSCPASCSCCGRGIQKSKWVLYAALPKGTTSNTVILLSKSF